jgi:hypothetical protein
MDTTLEQRKEAAVALLSGMLTTILQKDTQITDRFPAQPASVLDSLLAKPTTATNTRNSERDDTRTNEYQIFHIEDSIFDVGSDPESDTSSDDDGPIRNPRQLKSEMRGLKAMVRRANRRTARRAARITRHLDPSQATMVYDSLKALETPSLVPQHVANDALDEEMTEAVPPEDEVVAAASELSLPDLNFIPSSPSYFLLSSPRGSPFSFASSPAPSSAFGSASAISYTPSFPRDSPRSSQRRPPPSSISSGEITTEGKPYHCKPCNRSYVQLNNLLKHKQDNPYHDQKVADYARVHGHIREDEVDAEQIPRKESEHYCKDCNYSTPHTRFWMNHLRREKHVNNVARNAKRKGKAAKSVKYVAKKKLPPRYCQDCDEMRPGENFARHLRSRPHLYNVSKNKRRRSEEDEEPEMQTVQDLAEVDETVQREKPGFWCETCDHFYKTQNWGRHLAGTVHRFNVEMMKQKRTEITRKNSISAIHELQDVLEEQPERYCEDCDIYPGVRWTRHLASQSHISNTLLRLSRSNESMPDNEHTTHDEYNTDEEYTTHDEHTTTPHTPVPEADQTLDGKIDHYCED